MVKNEICGRLETKHPTENEKIKYIRSKKERK